LFRCNFRDAQLLHGAGSFNDDARQMCGHADEFAVVRAWFVRMMIIHRDGTQQHSIA
jgi:hypothetical protein